MKYSSNKPKIELTKGVELMNVHLVSVDSGRGVVFVSSRPTRIMNEIILNYIELRLLGLNFCFT